MIRGNFKISLLITVDGTTAGDTLRKAYEVAQHLEEKNILVAFDKMDAVQPDFLTVYTTEAPEMKINAIKEVRAFTGLGLKEAKDFVEGGYKLRLTVPEYERFSAMCGMCGIKIEGVPEFPSAYAKPQVKF